jgi:hypothetical protein
MESELDTEIDFMENGSNKPYYKLLQQTKQKVKVKQSHNTHVDWQGERTYSSYSFTSSALESVSGQRQAPAALYP